MGDQQNQSEDIDQRLSELLELAQKHRSEGYFRAALSASREARRLAKSEQRLIAFLDANFHAMNTQQFLLDPRVGQEAAIENIALLESPDRARSFQSNYDEAEYERTVQWMSACSYDNLATATGYLNGYNSEGMQACIADGISVCRRTGKLRCITCFREYATRVHRAADDIPMALHHARANAQRTEFKDVDDRRWQGAFDETDLLILQGELRAAWEAAGRSLALAEEYHSPPVARRETRYHMQTIAVMAGRGDWAAILAQVAPEAIPAGEDPLAEMRADTVTALASSVKGDHAAAFKLLAPWDRRLHAQSDLHHWFEIRLRMVAVARLAGEQSRADALAAQLKEKAKAADDFLTLHRLDELTSGRLGATPLPTLAPFDIGPFAGQQPASAGTGNISGAEGAKKANPDYAPSRPASAVMQQMQEIVEALSGLAQSAEASGAELDFAPIAQRLMSIQSPGDPEEAARLIFLAATLGRFPVDERKLWDWAQAVAAAHPQNGVVINVLATLGDTLRTKEGSALAEQITQEQIKQMFRKSLDLDSSRATNYLRAGIFYQMSEDAGEAERCFARGFRLDRSNEEIARRLAELYVHSGRPTEALTVLDMCVREGTESPQLLWDAGLRASGLGRHELAVTYFDRFETLEPNQAWVHYYRALSLLALEKVPQAAEAVAREATRAPRANLLHLAAVRASVAAAQNQPAQIVAEIKSVLGMKLAEIDYLTPGGIAASLYRLWRAAAALPVDHDDRAKLRDLLIGTSLMPEAALTEERKTAPKQSALDHFVVTLLQPLEVDSPFKLPGQQEWKIARFRYGVLAPNAEAATDLVIQLHNGRHANPATVESVERENGPYTDSPGITWQAEAEPGETEEA